MLNYDRLNDLIKKSGIKKAAICERLGRNYYYLRDAQKTNANIPDKDLTIIASMLNTTPEYLRDETDDPAPEQKEKTAVEIDSGLQEVYDIFSALNPENRAKLLELSRLYLDAQSKNGENQ